MLWAKYKYWIIGISGALVLAFVIFSKRKQISRYAKSFTGTNEIAGNLGWGDKEFEDLMKSAGWRKGEQWCMYFAKMIWLDKYPAKADIINKTLSGSSQQSYQAAKNDTTGFFEVTDKPKKGDIVIWQRVSSPASGHAGIVTQVSGDDFETVEGNTLDELESSDGGTVANKKHKLSEYNKQSGLKLRGFIHKK
jgi:hypothetical protein